MKKIVFILLVAFRILANDFDGSSADVANLGYAVIGDSINSRAVVFNPGGLGLLSGYEIDLSHINWGFGTSYDKLTGAYKNKYGGFGLNVLGFHNYFDGKSFQYQLGQNLGKLSMYNLYLSGSYGKEILRGLSVGGGATYIQYHLVGKGTSQLTYRAGVLYKTTIFENLFLRKPVEQVKKEGDFRVGLLASELSPGIENTKFGIGLSVLPIEYIKLNTDVVYNQLEGLQERIGIEARYLMKYGGLYLRGGYDFKSQDITIGGGLEMRYYKNFYRVNYVYKMGGISRRYGSQNWVSITIGEMTGLLKWIKGQECVLDKNIFKIQDYFVLKTLISASSREEETYRVSIQKMSSDDMIIRRNKIDKKLKQKIIENLSTSANLFYSETNSDLIVSGTITSKGELMQVRLEGRTKNNRLVMQNAFETEIEFDRDEMQKYNEIDLVIEKGKIKFLKEIQETEEYPIYVLTMASNISSWVSKSIRAKLSGHIVVSIDQEDVSLYVDNRYKGKISNGKIVTVMYGKHKLSFVKSGFPRVTKTIQLNPTERKTLKVLMNKGVFYAQLNVYSYPDKAKVYIDKEYKGTTPLTIKKIKNGKHTIKYKSRSGVWTEEINIDKDGEYNVYGIKRYADNFKELNSSFWKGVQKEEGISIEANNGIVLKGIPGDTIWEGTGVVSKMFKRHKLEVSMEGKVKEGQVLFGIVDEYGNGLGVFYKNNSFQFTEIGANSGKMSPILPVKEKGMNHKIKLKFYHGRYEIYIDNELFYSNVLTRDIDKKIRLVVLCDGQFPNRSVEASINKIKILN